MSRKLFLLLAALGTTVAMAQSKAPPAKSTADAEKKIEVLRKEIKTLTKAQREVEEKRNREAKQLRQIDQKVATSSQALTTVETAIAGTEKKLDSLESQQQKLETALLGQKEQLALLLRSAYRLGEGSELKLLLSQDKISEAARWLVYHRYFEQERPRDIRALAF